jgi:cytochrome c oxidase cbb3-type subunit 3/ubiquinol-cytochrome c reductase cytochrome c subunit
LDDPIYLALITDETVRRVIAGGVPGTAMPGFAISAGGSLTDQQVDILTRTMRTRWARPEQLKDVTLPPYSAADAVTAGSGAGDAQRGAHVYQQYCVRCHGADGTGGPKGSSIVDPSFLALINFN